jgi:molybdate transport system ATP-binding protein
MPLATMSPAPLVSLDRVDVDLDGSPVLHSITWQLPRGEHWGIVGANGSGKSTLLGLIAGTLWPAPERGERRYDFGDGPETDAVRARDEIVVVGHELQDRYARLDWNFTALDVVLSGVYRTDVPRRRATTEQRSRALAVMRRLAIARLAQRRFLELSRGEQRRVLIARGVVFEPAVLLLDEPASGLDSRARTELAAMLAVVAAERTLVCTAHVAADLPPMIEHYLRLEHGRIAAMVQRPSLATPNAPADGAAASRPVSATPEHGATPLISLEHADVWLGARHVLHDLRWRLESGQQWLVTGPNGSGKSTFLRLLHGQLRPAIGSEIRWPALGDPGNVWDVRKQVAWLSPELQASYRYPSTVRACIASGFTSSIGQTRPLNLAETERVAELIEELELGALADRPLRTLSYGQARRTLIARALANRPRVLLLDEPWEGLDTPMSELLNRTLAAVIATGTQLVCASHLTTHRTVFTHELVLEAGHVAFAGPLERA